MQRIQLEEDEKITRKEYLKRKKKQSKRIRKKSKITYILTLFFIVLVLYIVFQIVIYRRKNNFSYLADDSVNSQALYNVYYVTEGYSYNPKYSLNSIYSNGFNESTVSYELGFYNIRITPEYVIGMKDGKLFSCSKNGKDVVQLYDQAIKNFTIYGNEVYMILADNSKLYKYDLQTKENKYLNIDNVIEVLADENNVFVAKDEKIKKQLYKLDKQGDNISKIAPDANVSYVIESKDKLYFVNKADSNKIYSINKDGSDCKKLADICSASDRGVMRGVDGSKYMYVYNDYLYYVNSSDNDNLWKYNLNTGENVKEIAMQIEILQDVNETVFYKIKNERGVYLYNTNTKFMSEITKRKVKEFAIDIYTKVFMDTTKNNKINKN